MAVRVVANGGGGAVGPAGAAGSSGTGSTLDGATSIGATSIVVDAVPSNLTDGSYIAIDAGTNKCEVRRVDGISGTTLTLQTGRALKIAHSDNVNVWVCHDYWLPPEWWGASTDTTVDSYRSLINMLLDQSIDTAQFGVRGRGLDVTNGTYNTSRPLFCGDKARVDLSVKAFSPFGLDCSETASSWAGIPNQYLFSLAGQTTTATFDSTTDEVTLTATVGSSNYSDVWFYPRQGSTMPGGVEEGRRYFAITGDASGAQVTQITKSQDDPTPVDITSNGSGEIVAVSTGLARIHGGLSLDGNRIKGLNGFVGLVQQPSNVELYVQKFAVMGMSIGADQGRFENIKAIDCYCGVEFAGGLMSYMPQGNSEHNDFNMIFAEDARMLPGAGANQGIRIGDGFHWETPGDGSAQIQTLKPSATLTSGQFKLQFKNVKTGFIDWDATAAGVQTALEAHAAIGAGNVTCTQLTGTNLSDGNIKCDFTVGTLQWELWSGSSSTDFGGELLVTDSTLAGGTLSVNGIRPDGRNISYRKGRNNAFVGNTYANVTTMADGTTHAFLKVEGSAASSATNGYRIEDLGMSAQGVTVVDDSLRSVTLTSTDGSATGVAEMVHTIGVPGRHGSNVGSHSYPLIGEGGRRVKHNSLGAPTLEVQAGTSQADNAFSVKDASGTEGFAVDKDGWAMTKVGSKTHDWGSLASGSSDSTTVTVTGAAVGDFAQASMSVAPPAGVIYHAQVTAANTVTVTRFNISGSAHDPASGTLRATILQPTA